MSRSSNWRAGGTSLRRSATGVEPAGSTGGAAGQPAGPAVPELPDFDPEDIDPEELRDFMAADWVEVKADPGFRERLRSQLWKMLSRSHEDEDDEA